MNIYACLSCILSLKMAVIFFSSQLGGGKLLHLQCLISGFLNRVPDRERTVVQALVPGWILIGLWSQCMLLIMAIHFVEFCHCSQGIVLKTSPKQIPSSGCMVTTFLCAGYCELLFDWLQMLVREVWWMSGLQHNGKTLSPGPVAACCMTFGKSVTFRGFLTCKRRLEQVPLTFPQTRT